MEYSIDNIDDAIFNYLLTYQPNVWISTNTIFNELCNLSMCPELNNYENRTMNKLKFSTECRLITIKFPNIFKKIVNNKIYLIANTSKTIEDEETESNLLTLTESFMLLLKNNTIDNILYKQYNENDTYLHAICREENYDLFKTIELFINVNLFYLNKNNESLYEIIPLKSENGQKILLSLIHIHKELINEENKKYNDKYNKLMIDYNILTEKHKNLMDNNFICKSKLVLLIIIGLYIITILRLLFD